MTSGLEILEISEANCPVPVSFSVLTSTNSATPTKQFSLKDGRLHKEPVKFPYRADVRRVDCDLSELPTLFSQLTRKQCLVVGVSHLARIDEVQRRTQENFERPKGEPSLILLDHDAGTHSGDGMVAALASIMPEIAEAGRVSGLSTSAEIYSADGVRLSGAKPGHHTYLVAMDGSDIGRFGAVLFKRAWLAGYGLIVPAVDGAAMVRITLFDGEVFAETNRVVFEAGAELGQGLIQRRPTPIHCPGGALDTRLLRDLTAEEEATYRRVVFEAKVTARPALEAKREIWVSQHPKGPEYARKSVAARERGEINADEMVVIDHTGEVASLRDLVLAGRHKVYFYRDGGRRCQLMTDTLRVMEYSGGGGWLNIVNLQQPEAAWLRRHRHEPVKSLEGLAIGPGVTIIKASWGMGKTKLIGRPLIQSAASAVAISPRISLATALAGVLDIASYHEKGKQARKVAICINSIISSDWSQTCQQAEVVFIDEVLQVLRQLAHGPVTDRPLVLEALRLMIRNARTVLAADNDVTAEVIDFLEWCRPGENFRVVTAQADHSGLTVEWSAQAGAVDALYWEIQQAVQRGEKLIVATDSKVKALKLAKLLEGHKILVVTADSKGNPAQRAFMNNPNAECAKYDAIIHSPAISSGISIEAEHFHRGFGLFHGVITPTDAAQMLRRVRNITRWQVAFDWQQQHQPCGLISVNTILRAAQIAGAGHAASAFDRFVATWQAYDQIQKFKFSAGLTRYLTEAGFRVEEIDLEGRDLEVPDIDHERIEEIVGAKRLSVSEHSEMRRRTDLDSREVLEVRRAAISEFLKTPELTSEMVRFVEFDGGWKVLPRYELAAGYAAPQTERGHLMERHHDTLRKGIYDDLAAILGVDLRSGEGRFTKAQALHVAAYCRKSPETMVYLRIAPRRVLQGISDRYAIEFVRSVLNKIGVRTAAVRVPVTKGWAYEIELPTAMLDCLRARGTFVIGDGVSSAPGQTERKTKEILEYQRGVSLRRCTSLASTLSVLPNAGTGS